jgi:gamma-glutamylcyclotransferase (GGCT)/AIG2-like uncharacterized protein YtfP
MPDQKKKRLDAVYFAYGTLLLQEHMREFCPSAEPAGIMRLKGYRLGFARCKQNLSIGGCTLEEDAANTMYGILYRLPADELANLDKVSGVAERYWVQRNITLLDQKGEAVPAITYAIPEPDWDFTPAESYIQRIIDGAKAWPLPEDYRRQLDMILPAVGDFTKK